MEFSLRYFKEIIPGTLIGVVIALSATFLSEPITAALNCCMPC